MQFLLRFSYLVILFFLSAYFLFLPPMMTLVQHIAYQFDRPEVKQEVVNQVNRETRHLILFKNEGTGILTHQEVSHLNDVRVLVYKFAVLALVCGVLFFFFKQRHLGGEINQEFYLSIAGVLVFLTIILATIFPFFFEEFHQVLFPQGNYAFSADSLLIQTYPPMFWLLEFVFWQGGVIAWLLLQARHDKKKKF
jgi:hypothetical protein